MNAKQAQAVINTIFCSIPAFYPTARARVALTKIKTIDPIVLLQVGRQRWIFTRQPASSTTGLEIELARKPDRLAATKQKKRLFCLLPTTFKSSSPGRRPSKYEAERDHRATAVFPTKLTLFHHRRSAIDNLGR